MTVLTSLVTIVSALIGAWLGSRLAMKRLTHERAFDRRLDWYEQTVKRLHALGLQSYEAARRDNDESLPPEVRKQAWDDAVTAYDELAPFLLVAELYGQDYSIRIIERIAEGMSKAEKQSDRAKYFLEMSRELRWAAGQIAGECREHLGLKRISPSELSKMKGILEQPKQ